MKITVIGTGYVGLVTGLGFAEVGHSVLCYDNNTNKIKTLLKGVVPIYEAQAQELLDKHLKRKIDFTDDIQTAASHSDIIFLCINLKSEKNNLDEIEALVSLVDELVKKTNVPLSEPLTLVIKSTVPVGTHHQLERRINKKFKSQRIHLVTNPEFLSEGEAVRNFMHPYRLIIGAESKDAIKKMKKIYSYFKETPFLILSPTSAEMTKHVSNAFLATKISFMNEMAQLCENEGASIDEVQKGIGLDPRIGPHFIYPGPGFGGSCLPKDVSALIRIGAKKGTSTPLLKAVKKTNLSQVKKTVQKTKELIAKHKVKRLAVWGVSYKAGTDDLRFSPAVDVLRELKSENVEFNIHDPAALENFKHLKFPSQFKIAKNLEDSLQGADGLLVLTDWPEYKTFSLAKLKRSLKKSLIYDTRNIFPLKTLNAEKFNYYGTGRAR